MVWKIDECDEGYKRYHIIRKIAWLQLGMSILHQDIHVYSYRGPMQHYPVLATKAKHSQKAKVWLCGNF